MRAVKLEEERIEREKQARIEELKLEEEKRERERQARIEEEKRIIILEEERREREKQAKLEEEDRIKKIDEERYKRDMDILEKKKKLQDDKDQESKCMNRVKIPKFDESSDDMDNYIERFERVATIQKWDKTSWAVTLGTLLSGRALEVFTSMPADDLNNYELLKSSLLKRYQLTAEGFRRKFRESQPEEGESIFQFVSRLTRYFQNWMDLGGAKNTYEDVKDMIIKEQFMNMCSSGLVIFLKERVPKDTKEVVKLAEQFVEAHGLSAVVTSKQASATKCEICGKNNHVTQECFFNKVRYPHGPQYQQRQTQNQDTQGYQGWRQEEQTIPKVSGAATATYQQDRTQGERVQLKISGATADGTYKDTNGLNVMKARLNGKIVTILRDTGCNSAAVRRSLVHKDQLVGRKMECKMIDGTVKPFELTRLEVESPYYSGTITAMVMDDPMYDVILGSFEGVMNDPDPEWTLMAGSAVAVLDPGESDMY